MISKILFYCILLFLCSCSNNDKHRDDTFKKTAIIIDKANKHYNAEEYSLAKVYFDSLIKLDSLNGDYYFKRGYSKSMLLDLSGAISDYSKTIKYNGNRKKSALLNTGTVYYNMGNYDSAIIYLNECLKLEPNNEKALLMHALSLERLKQNTIR